MSNKRHQYEINFSLHCLLKHQIFNDKTFPCQCTVLSAMHEMVPQNTQIAADNKPNFQE